MGVVSWMGRSQEVAKPTATTWLKVNDACTFYSIIENFLWKNIIKTERGGDLLAFWSSKWHRHNLVRTHQFVCEDNQIPQLPKEGIDQWGVDCNRSFFGFELYWKQQILELCKIGKNKSTYIGSSITTSTKVQIPYLVSTMLIRWRKELNVAEGSTCNCFCPVWKLAFHATEAKMCWTISWVLVHSLSWALCKRWIPIGLMGCVQTREAYNWRMW